MLWNGWPRSSADGESKHCLRRIPAETKADDRSASTTFEWALGGRFLMNTRSPRIPAPDSLAIISVDADRETYVQHYFRLCAASFGCMR